MNYLSVGWFQIFQNHQASMQKENMDIQTPQAFFPSGSFEKKGGFCHAETISLAQATARWIASRSSSGGHSFDQNWVSTQWWRVNKAHLWKHMSWVHCPIRGCNRHHQDFFIYMFCSESGKTFSFNGFVGGGEGVNPTYEQVKLIASPGFGRETWETSLKPANQVPAYHLRTYSSRLIKSPEDVHPNPTIYG